MTNVHNHEDLGLRLERFSHGNADLVLAWRNAQHVRANSLNDEVIKREDHLRFVDGLKERTDRNFFIVHIQGAPVAVLNVNDHDGIGSWGCYLSGGEDRTVRPGIFPILIGIAGVIAFELLTCQELHSDVLEANLSPQTMNSFLGIPLTERRVEIRPSGQEIPVVCYALSKDMWPPVRSKINKVLTKRHQQLLEDFSKNPSMLTNDDTTKTVDTGSAA